MSRLLQHAAAAGLVLATAAAPARAQARAATPARAAQPTLLVFLTVDQLRPDYFTRFGDQLTGGLARLARGGAVFTNAFQDHAITETAPGHASTMSGRFPRSTGIVQNSEGVEDPHYPLIGATGPGASPYRFRGTVLTDWLRAKDPRTRALSVSRKDRGAILPLGRTNQQVFWYAPSNGTFTTSTWYRDTLPGWVQRFNARRLPQQYAGKSWTLLLDERAYSEPDSVPAESRGRDFVFPHALPSDAARAISALPDYPWMDELTLQFALEGMQALDLGRGPQTDVLAISLSTTDAVGHRYGPDSRELHDQILRLDRSLGAFFDSLYTLRDSTRIIVALTADHGVAPFPTVRSRDPNQGAHYVDVRDTVAAFTRRVRAAGVDSAGFVWDSPFLVVRRERFAAARVNADSVVTAFARALRRIPGVAQAEPLGVYARRDTTKDTLARRWLHMIPPEYPVALTVTLAPYHYWAGVTYATHGTPYDYDARVPVIFYGAPFRPGHYGAFARVVDMAPTLADVLGAPPLERLDGRVLRAALR